MVATSKRLEFLQKMTIDGLGTDDPFAWYGLAMEYRSLGRFEEALTTFETLRAKAQDYVPMYLMCGEMLEKVGRIDEARAWLSLGVEAARKKGDGHAMGELQGALEALG